MLPLQSETLAKAIKQTIFSSNKVLTVIVFNDTA